jgi:hypothetical protein
MTMMISKAPNTQGQNVKHIAPSPVVESSDFKVQQAGGQRSGNHANKHPNVISGSSDHTTIHRLDVDHTERNHYARQIRTFDRTMEKVGTQIRNMKQELKIIVKNYPPFPPGSEDRIAALRRFNSFRKQIEQLTFPPSKEGNDEQAGSPASPHVGIEKGSLVIEAVEGDGYIYSVRNVEKQPTRLEVQLPELAEDADDVRIQTALEKLETTSANIQAHRQAVKLDAQNINVGKENSEFFFMTESNAEENSYALRRDMAFITHVGLTKEPAHLIGFLS